MRNLGPRRRIVADSCRGSRLFDKFFFDFCRSFFRCLFSRSLFGCGLLSRSFFRRSLFRCSFLSRQLLKR